MKYSKKTERKLLEIAMQHMPPVADRGDLKTRNSDSEDFLNVAGWGLRDALMEAYELGKDEKGENRHER